MIVMVMECPALPCTMIGNNLRSANHRCAVMCSAVMMPMPLMLHFGQRMKVAEGTASYKHRIRMHAQLVPRRAGRCTALFPVLHRAQGPNGFLAGFERGIRRHIDSLPSQPLCVCHGWNEVHFKFYPPHQGPNGFLAGFKKLKNARCFVLL